MPVFGGGKHDVARRKAKLEEARANWKKTHKRGWEPVTMSVAWDELSTQAFALFTRLHTFTAQQLKSGRAGWERSLGVSQNTMRYWLRELVNAGYIELVPKANGKKTGLVLKRRIQIKFGSRNVWFSRI